MQDAGSPSKKGHVYASRQGTGPRPSLVVLPDLGEQPTSPLVLSDSSGEEEDNDTPHSPRTSDFDSEPDFGSDVPSHSFSD